MLSDLVKEHSEKYGERRETLELKRKAAISSAGELTEGLVDHLNVRVAQAYLNQKKLDEEVKVFFQNAENFSKQVQEWDALLESFNNALKEIGDLENWARIMEQDMKEIAGCLEQAYKAEEDLGTTAEIPEK